MAMLFVTKGPAMGEKFSLEGHQLVMIGRDAGCTIQIIDPQLSRCHMQIKYAADEKRHYAVDFQSKNGVFVNGEKISEPAVLNDRDAISLGDTVLVYSIDDSVAAQHVLDAMKRMGQGHLHTRTS
jgi:pSer/pThr/pTyr-binding forkhead associated (FHA) protein